MLCIIYTNGPQEFPYLTLSTATDMSAGVKFSARQCFSLEILSVGIGGDAGQIELQEGCWGQLLGKGKICGEERWVVGENGDGEVVVLRF